MAGQIHFILMKNPVFQECYNKNKGNESGKDMDKRKTANHILGAAFATCLATAPFQGSGLWQAGLFHIAFAATVGGIADWFAVTSLFEKPMGISYRTDIIANRRDKIVEMAKEMVSEELLPPEKLEIFFQEHLPSEILLTWIKNHREPVGLILEEVLQLGMSAIDRERIESLLIEKAEETAAGEDWAERIAFVLETLKSYEKKEVLRNLLAKEVGRFLENRFTLAEVQSLYEGAWSRYREQNWFRGILQQVIEDQNEEAVRILRENILHIADTVKDPESEICRALENAYDRLIFRLRNDEPFKNTWNGYVSNALSAWMKRQGPELIKTVWRAQESHVLKNVSEFLLRKAEEQLSHPEKKEKLDTFLLHVCVPWLPWVHKKIKESVEYALSGYDGREMAKIAKDGVHQDIQMIRINGSLCGGVLGGLFYLVSILGGLF